VKRVPGWHVALAGLTACALATTALPAYAKTAVVKKPQHIALEGSLGAGSALASLVWAPIKLVHAAGGLLIGGLGLLWTGGDGEVSKRVFKRALTGDYVITPDHLQGKKRLRFSGSDSGGKDKEGGGDEGKDAK
jgi:hypothetical protein